MTMMKRPSPLLPASSSDDEKMLEEDLVVKENMVDEEAEEEKEEDEDDESIFIVKKHAVISTPAQPKSSSSSMGEEEEESNPKSARSDSDLPPPPPPPTENTTTKSSPNNITDVKKPITPIPMSPLSAKRVLYEATDNKPVEGEVSKKRRKKQKKNKNGVDDDEEVSEMKSSNKLKQKKKNSVDDDGEVSEMKSSNKLKQKKKKNNGVDDDGEVSEMKSSNKLWSKADEIVILKGLLSSINKHGAAKPTSELIGELHANIKELLQREVTNDQLYGKIRKLKQKYLKSTINDSKLDELAKKIWGTSEKKIDFKVGEEEEEEEEEEMTNEQATDGGVNSAAPVKKERKDTTEPSLPLPSFFKELIEAGKNSIVPPEGLKSFLTKEALESIGSSKAKNLQQKWNKLQIAEAQIYLNRIDLVKEQMKLLLDAFGTKE